MSIELNTFEVERMERDYAILHDALIDIRELVEGRADVDAGRPNLAMQVLVVVKLALREEP